MSSKTADLPAQVFRSPKCHALTRDERLCPNFAQKNGRCRLHGGLSTGPKTIEGQERSKRGNWQHGFYTQAAKNVNRIRRY
jgi:hypothetical protein